MTVKNKIAIYSVLAAIVAISSLSFPNPASAGSVSLSVPSNAQAGQSITVSWSGLSDSHYLDWIGFYYIRAADNPEINWFHANTCTYFYTGSPAASGSCSFTIPSWATVGQQFNFRYFGYGAYDKYGTSNTLTVGVPPTMSMSASPSTVGVGGLSTISWSSTNATGGCNVSGNTGASGSFSTGSLSSTTTYNGQCNGVGPAATASATVNVTYPAPTCTSATPDGDTFLSTASLSRATTVNGVSGATSVSFPTWSESGGQDDIIWYPGINLGGGVWRANISTASHPGIGNIFVHVYIYNPSYPSGIFCDSANFLRLNTGAVNVITNHAGASWDIDYSSYPGYGPWAGSSTSGTYSGVPYGTYVFTPSAISGYTSSVTPSVTQNLE